MKRIASIFSLYQDSKAWGRVRDGFADLARLAGAQQRIPVLVAVFPIDEGQGFSPYPLRELHERVMAEAQRNGLHALDLTPSFRAVRDSIDEELFLDFPHLNTDGARVAAAAILQWLCESGFLPGDGIDFTSVLNGDPFDVEIAAALIDRTAE